MPYQPLMVHMFGKFSLERESGEARLPAGEDASRSAEAVQLLPAASGSRRLLAYLLLERRPHERLSLAGRLWPDGSEASARRSLRQSIWQANRCLPGLVLSSPNHVELNPHYPLQVDMIEFERLTEPIFQGQVYGQAAANHLARAAALYQGDLLDGYYDDWVFVERERLRERYFHALEGLIPAYKSTLRFDQALDVALQLARADPLRESAHREAMRLYYYLGNPAAALKQYRACREVLKDELGIEPDSETRLIAREIARHAAPAADSYLPQPPLPRRNQFLGDQVHTILPLIGRNAERARLLEWIWRPRPGSGGLVLVEGEAGVGKTRLLQEVARDSEWRGAQVLWGKARQMEPGRPLSVLVEALDSGLTPLRVEQLQRLLEPLWLQVLQPLLPRLLESLPDLQPAPALERGKAKTRLVEALSRLLAAWSRISPLLIIIEDVQWAGADTLEILLRLPLYLVDSPAAILLCYRGEELSAQPDLQAKLAAFPETALGGRLALQPLEIEAARQLIHACLGSGLTTLEFDTLLHQHAAGNPLFILETLRVLYDEGVMRPNAQGDWITPYDSQIGVPDLPLPPALEEVILSRLGQLPGCLRAMVEKLAVLGNSFRFEQLIQLNLAGTQALLESLQELLKRRLLVETPQSYQFRHDKIRQVIYESVEPDRRRGLHLSIAEALERSAPDQLAGLADHYTHGQNWRRALHYHRQAAQKAILAHAYATAVQHLDQALECAEQAGCEAAERFSLLEMHSEAVQVLGDPLLFGRDLDRMAQWAGADAARLAVIVQKKMDFCVQNGRYAEAEELARQAMILAQDTENPSLRAGALVVQGIVLDIRGERQATLDCLGEAACLYRETGDGKGEAQSRAYMANTLAKTEQRPAAFAEFEKVLEMYAALDLKPDYADLLTVLGILSELDGEYERSLQYSQHALDLCRSTGYRVGEVFADLARCSVLVKLGQIGPVLQTMQRALTTCQVTGEQRLQATIYQQLAYHYRDVLGDYPAARHAARAGFDLASQVGDLTIQGLCLKETGYQELHAGRLEPARQSLETALACLTSAQAELRLGSIYEAFAELELAEGQPQAAQVRLQTARSIYEKLSLEIPENWFFLGARAFLSQGQPEQALATADMGIESLTSLKRSAYRLHYLRSTILNSLGDTGEALRALELAHEGLEKILSGLEQPARELSAAQGPAHREILQAWQAAHPRPVRLRLPRAGAAGRIPGSGETVEVECYLDAPEDAGLHDKVSLRRRRLARLLEAAAAQGGAPTRQHLAVALEVSLRTIAQDLAALKNGKGVP